jgi:hypothetical protein
VVGSSRERLHPRGGTEQTAGTPPNRHRPRPRAWSKPNCSDACMLPSQRQERTCAQQLLGISITMEVPLNFKALGTFHHCVMMLWWQVLNRRSQTGRISVPRMNYLAKRWLPRPRIFHPFPSEPHYVGFPTGQPKPHPLSHLGIHPT